MIKFRERMAIIINSHGGIVKFSAATGISRRTLSSYIGGQSEPTRQNIIKMAEVAKVCSSWLVGGKPGMECWNNPAWLENFDPIDKEPQPSCESIFSLQVMFRWLNVKFNRGPNDLSLVEVCDDSMQPTLEQGALVIVDHGVTDIQNNSIFLFRIDGKDIIRRVQILTNGSVKIMCDNRLYTEETNGESFISEHITGKVMGVIRGL